MRVEQVCRWTSLNELAKQVKVLMFGPAVVIVKGADWTREQYHEFMAAFGHPTPQYPGHQSSVLTLNGGEDDRPFWYNQTFAMRMHFDGINCLPDSNRMPINFLYGKSVHRLYGGLTLFRSTTDLYEEAMADPLLAELDWTVVDGMFSSVIYNEKQPRRMLPPLPVRRISKYSQNPYLLIDQTNIVGLKTRIGDELDEKYLNRYWELIVQGCYRFIWEQGDVLIWPNEEFVHGRTKIFSGDRVLWRGTVLEP